MGAASGAAPAEDIPRFGLLLLLGLMDGLWFSRGVWIAWVKNKAHPTVVLYEITLGLLAPFSPAGIARAEPRI